MDTETGQSHVNASSDVTTENSNQEQEQNHKTEGVINGFSSNVQGGTGASSDSSSSQMDSLQQTVVPTDSSPCVLKAGDGLVASNGLLETDTSALPDTATQSPKPLELPILNTSHSVAASNGVSSPTTDASTSGIVHVSTSPRSSPATTPSSPSSSAISLLNGRALATTTTGTNATTATGTPTAATTTAAATGTPTSAITATATATAAATAAASNSAELTEVSLHDDDADGEADGADCGGGARLELGASPAAADGACSPLSELSDEPIGGRSAEGAALTNGRRPPANGLRVDVETETRLFNLTDKVTALTDENRTLQDKLKR